MKPHPVPALVVGIIVLAVGAAVDLPAVSASPDAGDSRAGHAQGACYDLTVEVDGGRGSLKIVTPPNCYGGQFSQGTPVTLEANPAPGYRVYAWRGTDHDASGSVTNTVTMAHDRRVGVHYVSQGDPTVPVKRGTPGGVAKVYGSGDRPATVIGSDSRVRIANTTDEPWRRIADLDVKQADGSWATCTGFFLGPRVVATAGHCVFNFDFGGWAQEIKVTPGRDGSLQPYGSSTSSDLWTIGGWLESGLTDYDFGAIVLPDDSLGNQVGWFESGYYSDAHVLAATGHLAGYPDDKSDPACAAIPACQLWLDSDPVRAVSTWIVSYEIDTYGEDGSPVWEDDGAHRRVIAIHTSDVGRSGCNPGDNCGTRMNPNVAWFFQELGAPPPDTDCLHSLTIHALPTGAGSVSRNVEGTPGCPGGIFAQGDVVGLTAYPGSGYEFASWSGTDDDDANPTTVTINGNTSITAYFREPDNTPPQISFSYSASTYTWYNTDQRIDWTLSDGQSGVWGYSRQWDGDPGGSSPQSTGSSGSVYLSGAGEGQHRIYVRGWDNRGNSGLNSAGEFWYDVSAPGNPTGITSASHSLRTWSSDNTIDASWSGASDSASGVYGYSVEWSPSPGTVPDTSVDTTGSSATSPALGDGNNWYVHVRARDGAGNWNSDAVHLGPFYLDRTGPGGSIVIAGGASYVSSRSVSLALAASDSSSGLSQMQFSNTGSSWSTWENYATSRAWTLSAGDGLKAVYVRYRDNAGNVSTPYSDNIILDTTGPTGSIAVAGGATYVRSNNVGLSLSASDSGSGVWQMQFSNDGSSWSAWESYAASKAWMLIGGDGQKTVSVRFRDSVGNVSTTFFDSVILDTTQPTGSILIEGGAAYVNSTSVSLALAASDPGSGMWRMQLSNNGSSWGNWESYANSKAWTLASGDGIKTVYVRYMDNAGNISPPYSDDVILDTAGPAGAIVIADGAAYLRTTGVSLTLSASDPGSGVWQMQFSDDGSSWSAWESYATSKAWTLTSGDGRKTVYARYRDNAGSVSTVYSDSVTLDTTAPAGSIVIQGGALVVTSTAVVLTIAAVDANGIPEMRLRNDAGTWNAWEPFGTSRVWTLAGPEGERVVWAQFRDVAGNESSPYSDSVVYQAPYHVYLPLILRGN